MSAVTQKSAVAGIDAAHLFEMRLDLSPAVDLGETAPDGRRALLGAEGGSFEGKSIRGGVLARGGDWALIRNNGCLSLDIRLVLRTDENDLIFMTGGGRFVAPPSVLASMRDRATRHLIDPSTYYFRTPFQFETGSRRHARLNDIVCIAIGRLTERGVVYQVMEVL